MNIPFAQLCYRVFVLLSLQHRSPECTAEFLRVWAPLGSISLLVIFVEGLRRFHNFAERIHRNLIQPHPGRPSGAQTSLVPLPALFYEGYVILTESEMAKHKDGFTPSEYLTLFQLPADRMVGLQTDSVLQLHAGSSRAHVDTAVDRGRAAR